MIYMAQNGGAQQEFYVIVTFRYGWRESFIGLLLVSFVIWHRMLSYKETSYPEDECNRDVHASLDMW